MVLEGKGWQLVLELLLFDSRVLGREVVDSGVTIGGLTEAVASSVEAEQTVTKLIRLLTVFCKEGLVFLWTYQI